MEQFDNGDYVHVRCCAHILNMIMRDGLKDKMDFVCKIRVVIKYVRSSLSQLANFKKYVIKQNIDFKGLVCLDVETRWSFTYLMLDATLNHQKAFEEFQMEEMKYAYELRNEGGVPISEDQEFVCAILSCLKLFYDATLHMYSLTHATSNLYMFEAFQIGR